MPLVEVKVPITGVVWKIEVEVGAKVEENQTLIILESMKTEIPILTSQSGTIKEIKVNLDEMVTEGDVAVIIEA
jgi:biotin carboxyl carrier protein